VENKELRIINNDFECLAEGRNKYMKELRIKNQELSIKLGFFALITLLMVSPLACQAFFFEDIFDDFEKWFSGEKWSSDGTNSSEIINEVNVSVSTGETTINGNGEIKEGETKTEIHVENIVNGTEIDPIDIESDAGTVKVESEISVDDGIAQVQRETEIDSETSTENYEVNLESSGTGTEKEDLIEPEIFENWWSDFIEDLKSFFEDIFNIF